MTLALALAAAAVGVVWLAALPRLAARILVRAGLVRPNYRGAEVPVAYGVLIAAWALPAFCVLWLLAPARRLEAGVWLLVVGTMALLGFIDDRWGDRRAHGLRGHVWALLRDRRITTGLVKALGGLAVSFLAAALLLRPLWLDVVLAGLLIALCANALNLLDLRPGRAAASFLVVSAGLLSVLLPSGELPGLLLVAVPAAAAYPRDARALAMLGDTGSNVLGASLGLALVLAFPSPWLYGLMLVPLVGLHVVAERWSLTAIIERTPWLQRLDRCTGKR